MNYRLILGNRNYSSWSLRGWLLLDAFGIEFDCEVVRLYVSGYRDFLERHFPAATVPALQVSDAGKTFNLWDSLAIAEFLHERHPGAGIWPADPTARAAARCLCAEMHSSYLALRNAMPMNLRREPGSLDEDAAVQRDIARIEELWAWALDKWGGAEPYLFGEFCAADAFFAPVASRFRTYRVELLPGSQSYVNALLDHPATRAFIDSSREESWVIDEFEI